MSRDCREHPAASVRAVPTAVCQDRAPGPAEQLSFQEQSDFIRSLSLFKNVANY